uniref:Rx N-terminal domain-containing protein n=1 Tax=Fagus sylvatica TaxID=28930 RepID=A0A2N9FAP2_FAGSY
MAEAILFGVTQTIIERLGSYTLQQIGSIWDVKAEFEKMTKTVSTIQAVLQDAEEQQVNNRQVSDWLMKLRDAVLDADDLLSDFSTHVLRQTVMGADKMPKKVFIFFSSSNQLVFGLKMARKIKAMRGRLDDIAKDRKDFQLESRSLETPVVIRGRGQTHSYVPEEEVIGRENDKKAIIDLLLDFDLEENVSFISIMGIGGQVRPHLLNLYTVMRRSATGRKSENLEIDPLQDELRKTLDQKKYLLVLDDLWNEENESWCNLKIFLTGGSKGSKVMITTRSKLVAEISSTVSPYFLKGLSKNQSWDLLKRMAFKKGQDPIDTNLEAIGMDIIEKCQGVPLVIKAVGRVLYFKKTEGEWLHIKNNELTNVTQLKDGILPVLKLSYDYLPSHLKCCFAYCSLFPKDYVIHKLTLIQLWIAQGFIQSPLGENLQLEDVANEYFMDLHWRSFFQEAQEYDGVIMSVKMHDLIHDLAQSVSRIECKLVDSNAKNVNDKVRHLSFPFYNVFGENLSLLVKANKIRTFILTCESYWPSNRDAVVEESTLKTLIFTFRYLRALDLHELNIKTVPNIIGKLMHLKYLDLSFNEVLPSSITKLVNLQTLNLCGCGKLRKLPTNLQKLVYLRQLDTSDCYNLTHMPCGLGKLTSLQTLTFFVVSKEDPTACSSSKHCGGLAELNKLDLRGELEINNLEWVKDATSETKAANLKEKKHLNKLVLRWNPRVRGREISEDEISLNGLQPHQSLKCFIVRGYGGVRFSNWFSSLTNLVTLAVYNCKKCQHLPPLYQLPYLRELRIEYMLGLEYMSDRDITDEISASLPSSSTTFFPSLEWLRLFNCPNLKGWWKRDIVDNSDVGTASTSQQHISLPSFPRLSQLVIENCCKLTCMPLFPHLEKQLSLGNASLKPLQQTMAMTMNTAETSSLPSSSFLPLSKLKHLSLCKMQNVESLPIPEEWVQNLTLLEELEIWECPTLTSLSRFMQHLTSLKTLRISNCEEVDLFSDVDDYGSESQRPTSTCLQSLTFGRISKLEALPAYLQHVTTLQYLSISQCPSFTTLPEWLDNLTSLHTLVIIECPNLTSLPEGMRHLSSLQSLRISNCPHLEQRCQKEVGEDWSKMAHVPKYSNRR